MGHRMMVSSCALAGVVLLCAAGCKDPGALPAETQDGQGGKGATGGTGGGAAGGNKGTKTGGTGGTAPRPIDAMDGSDGGSGGAGPAGGAGAAGLPDTTPAVEPPDAAQGGGGPGDAPAGEGGGGSGPAGAYENSLGMRFVPVAGTTVIFSIWETRARDFEAYAMATNAPVPHPDFPEGPLQPKAAVSRAQAEAFAQWLTQAEQKLGQLAPGQRYRLPTDKEWDVAFAAGQTGGKFPWGGAFPPPDHFANYGVSKDGFAYTAPVGSFPPNRFGLFDMAGNLWEWIGEGCAQGGAYLVRGAGWNAQNPQYLDVSFHYCFGGDLIGHHNVGFRLVREGATVPTARRAPQ